MESDLDLAFRLADAADGATLALRSPDGVSAAIKEDGTPVTEADVAAERAVLELLLADAQGDGFLGEEIGERAATNDRRWIVDGIDGTRFFVAGQITWGTLLALEVDGEIVVGVSSSPAQGRRWWAARGAGAFAGTADRSSGTRIRVSSHKHLDAGGLVTLPRLEELSDSRQQLLTDLAGGHLDDRPWSHQNRVAEGEIAACVWFAGDIWDHAAPSIIVEEAGGRFSDHWGGKRLDTRTAVYSNGICHDQVLEALVDAADPASDGL